MISNLPKIFSIEISINRKGIYYEFCFKEIIIIFFLVGKDILTKFLVRA